MRYTLTLFAIIIALFSGCKKETTTPNPVDPFAANDALISSNANLYIIADVEGLAGVTHINQQDTIWGVLPQWSSGHCTNGDCAYGGGLGYISGSPTWVFKAEYNGTGETHEDLLVQNYTTFITPAHEHHGIILWYIAENGNAYYSYISNNLALSWANVTLVNREATGEASTPTSTPYYVKLHFNCEMTNASNSSDKITFKNAVARVKM